MGSCFALRMSFEPEDCSSKRRKKNDYCVAVLGEPQLQKCLIDALPDAVLVYNVLNCLDSSDLCNMISVSKRMRTLQVANDEQVWGSIVSRRWEDGIVGEAVALAGSYRAFALQKQAATTQLGFAADGWHGPCEFELQASLARIASVMRPPATSSQVLFLLDGSGSVGDEEFDASTSFIARAASAMKANPDHECKVAVMQFSNDVRTEWEDAAGVTTDTAAFESTIKSMVRMNGGTNIAAALTQAGKMLKKNAASPDLAKAIVLITDGRVDGYQAKEARHVAAQLADEQPNTTMFAFGVGRGVDRAELLGIIQPAAAESCKYKEAAARYLDLFYKDEAPW